MSQPFLKWAGGKRWLVLSRQLPIPRTYRRYVEPFLGSGAVFFHVRPEHALLSDINPELMELYEVVRKEPTRLLRLLEIHHALHTAEYYYSLRAARPDVPLERAARTLYLNRTCWNGLYRVNLNGSFNVPIGTKTNVVFDGESFIDAANILRNAELRCADFESIISEVGGDDFLFVDPPYTVQHNMNGFLKYNEKIFGWSDQVRLRDAVRGAIERGASVVVTNADHESIRYLYADICDYRKLRRHSILAGKAVHRGKTTEAVFSANL